MKGKGTLWGAKGEGTGKAEIELNKKFGGTEGQKNRNCWSKSGVVGWQDVLVLRKKNQGKF